MIQSVIGYRIEGDSISLPTSNSSLSISSGKSEVTTTSQQTISYKTAGKDLLENPKILDGVFDLADADNDYVYYKDQIVNKGAHVNFLCAESLVGPVIVSYFDDVPNKTYVALSRTSSGSKRILVPYAVVPRSWWRVLLGIGPSYGDILKAIESTLPLNRLKRIADPRLPQALLSMEEQQQIRGFKFGVLYSKEGQTKEDEMFHNVETSSNFEEFLDFLGDRVKLEGWKGFRGGLDVRSGTTGEHSIYRKFNNNEIMFHVSTMLPYNPKDKQQLERKRHIGNDIVVIIYQEGDTIYKPTTISSRQVHVVFVVKTVKIPDDPTTYYRLSVVSKDGVPAFGPQLGDNLMFPKGETFLKYFYAKLLNAERACYSAPILANKLTRTRTSMLRDIAQTFL